jgi:hypothetical protein
LTDNIQHIDVDSDEFIDAPKALRDHVKKLQQANTRLTETNSDLSGRVTASALNGVLSEFKNPERVKRDLLTDKVDPLNSEAVAAWLERNAGDYAKGDGASTTTSTPNASNEEVAAHQRLQPAGDLRTPGDMTRFEAAQAEITPDMDGQAIKALYRKHGV